MADAFEVLIAGFIENGIGYNNTLLDTDLCAALRLNLETLQADEQMHSARIGNREKQVLQADFRSDKIFWLDRNHGNPAENKFLDLMDALVLYLNTTCYTGITGHEFHYALFDKGSFYKRHLDQFQSDQGRLYSVICYLNEYWEEAHGGQLCIYKGTENILVAPINGKCVFFKSNELEHEVLMSHQPRMSLTGWLKRSSP